jgi:hypothetical protein
MLLTKVKLLQVTDSTLYSCIYSTYIQYVHTVRTYSMYIQYVQSIHIPTYDHRHVVTECPLKYLWEEHCDHDHDETSQDFEKIMYNKFV